MSSASTASRGPPRRCGLCSFVSATSDSGCTRARSWAPALGSPSSNEDTYRRLVALLTDPARRTSPASSAIRYLLSGLARCGVCAGPLRVLIARGDGRKSDSYVCQHGYHVRRSRPGLDALVTGLVTARLARPDAAAVLAPATTDRYRRRLRRRLPSARLDTAADAYADGTLDGAQLTRITSRLRRSSRDGRSWRGLRVQRQT